MFLLLITHMVTRQLTVDKDMKDADRTYVLANEIWAGGHILLGDKLQSRYPEIEDWCAVSGSYEQFVRTNDQPVNIQMMFVRENFFRFFNFHLLEGNPEPCWPMKQHRADTFLCHQAVWYGACVRENTY